MAHTESPAEALTTATNCCSIFYEQDWVRLLAEDSFHPGGEALTRRTAAAMALSPNDRVVDIGSGTGTSALLLERAFGWHVTGIDPSRTNVDRARVRALEAEARAAFFVAEANDLPLPDEHVDGLLAECVFSLLGDKAGALREFRRVLKPGGRIGLTDMALSGTLPRDLAEVAAPWTCLADALDEAGYVQGFEAGGFDILKVVDESDALTLLLGQLKRQLLVIGAGGLLSGQAALPFDLRTVKNWIDRFQAEVDAGTIRYLRFQLQS